MDKSFLSVAKIKISESISDCSHDVSQVEKLQARAMSSKEYLVFDWQICLPCPSNEFCKGCFI
jgi:hypothetical protein